MNEITVFGQEKTLETVKLCKMNLSVHGITGDIKQGNTYYDDIHDSLNKFEFVMANPPFNVNGVNKEMIKTDKRYKYGIPSLNNANYLWIQIFLNSLNTKGRTGFVMANIATEAGQSELKIREKIIKSGYVDIIIAIGPNFFYNVTLSCTLWFFDKSKGDLRQDKTLFIDVRKIYHKIDRTHRIFLPKHIEFITNIVKLFRNEKPSFNNNSKDLTKKYFPNDKYRDNPGLCKVTTTEDIINQGFSLNPGRYVGFEKREIEEIDFYEELEKSFNNLKDLNKESRLIEKLIEDSLETFFNPKE
ncbi:hypothetical protein LCGC14_1154160 [marine sediment metagenome]|uniref:DNA methylase adenine-specific domain-containing protein n=1 Tax=marine sediment metagenome TaxID=412755 RepID=A0A0F9Q048_9ZZZZ|nr:hypothetical protein [archaeon]